MNISKFSLLLLTATISISLISCSSSKDEEQSFPKTNEKIRDAKRGKITGDEGVILFGGANDKRRDLGRGDSISAGVNAYLWQASLDVISFMPISTVDATGGVIITDWYEDPAAHGERIKANIVISSADLRASGVKVSLFRQANGKSVSANPELARKLEDKILTRAREIKIENNRL